jgi:hypothetical protein
MKLSVGMLSARQDLPHELLDVQGDGLGYFCGNDPSFVAALVDEEQRPIEKTAFTADCSGSVFRLRTAADRRLSPAPEPRGHISIERPTRGLLAITRQFRAPARSYRYMPLLPLRMSGPLSCE